MKSNQTCESRSRDLLQVRFSTCSRSSEGVSLKNFWWLKVAWCHYPRPNNINGAWCWGQQLEVCRVCSKIKSQVENHLWLNKKVEKNFSTLWRRRERPKVAGCRWRFWKRIEKGNSRFLGWSGGSKWWSAKSPNKVGARRKAAIRQNVELAQTASTLSDPQCQPNCFTWIVWNFFLWIYVWFQGRKEEKKKMERKEISKINYDVNW